MVDDAPFSMFSMGLTGIPDRFARIFRDGGDKQVAEGIVRFVQKGGKPSDEIKAMSLLLAERAGTPPHILRALAYSMELISPNTGQPLPPASMRAAIGLPPTVKRFREFTEVAARQAFALALTVLRDHPPHTALPENASPLRYLGEVANRIDALTDLIDRVKANTFVLSDKALATASEQRWEINDDGTMVEVGSGPKIARSTISAWRKYPEFIHIIAEVGGALAVRLDAGDDPTDRSIREIALKIPAEELLAIAGQVPTVWSAAPKISAEARAAFARAMATKLSA
jgi:hypothetical protein